MTTISILGEAGAFAEDKDIAAGIREHNLRPALDRGDKIRLDFSGVDGATQSFVHALISELIRKNGSSILDRIEFKKCNPTVRAVVEIVVEYSQLTDGTDENTREPGAAKRRQSPSTKRRSRTSGQRRALKR